MGLNLNYSESPKKFFEAYHKLYDNENDLINPSWKLYQTKYHYNMVENGIIELLLGSMDGITNRDVLDVGSGTGHWVDFYRDYLSSRYILGVDFSEVAIERLKKRKTKITSCEVEFKQLNITEHQNVFDNSFDIINAIGVMFHIVDDVDWEKAVTNLCSYLRPGGVLIVGGDFGNYTATISHHRRVRSMPLWVEKTVESNLHLVGLRRFNEFDSYNKALRNNLAAFIKVV